MKAFHNDPAIKAKYVNRMAAHIAADELIHGVGWRDGKGCAVGCTFDAYDHSRGPVELGLPVWLMRLEDAIFEHLSNGEARDFVSKFLTVIPVGTDIEPVEHRLAICRLDRLLMQQRASRVRNSGQVKAAITQVISALENVRNYHEARLSGKSIEKSAAWSARSAAWSVAWSAAWKQEADDLLELLAAA